MKYAEVKDFLLKEYNKVSERLSVGPKNLLEEPLKECAEATGPKEPS